MLKNISDLSRDSRRVRPRRDSHVICCKTFILKGSEKPFLTISLFLQGDQNEVLIYLANGAGQDVLYYLGIFPLYARPNLVTSLAPAVNHEMINDETKDAACLTSETIHGRYPRTPGGRLLLTQGRQDVK